MRDEDLSGCGRDPSSGVPRAARKSTPQDDTTLISMRWNRIGRNCIRGCTLRVPLPVAFDGSLLRFVIHVHQSEALAQSFGPLEIVEQTPCVIAPHVGAIADGVVEFRQILLVVGDAARVVDFSVCDGSVIVGTSAL